MMAELTKWLETYLGPHPYSVITTNISAAVFSGLLIWLCFQLSEERKDKIINLFATMMGALSGWVLGIFFTPYNGNEEALFLTTGQTISAFLSGYVVSKVDRYFESTLFNGDKAPHQLTWIRIGLAGSALLLALIWVFTNRLYFRAFKQ